MRARFKEELIENIIKLSNSVPENVKRDLLDYWKIKQLYMKNGVFCLENDAKTTNDMIFELQEENEKLKLDNAKLQEKYNLVYQENQMNIIRNKEREKNYLRTNAEKDKRIRNLEQQLYEKNNSQGSLFK
jgi:hypothetical protein